MGQGAGERCLCCVPYDGDRVAHAAIINRAPNEPTTRIDSGNQYQNRNATNNGVSQTMKAKSYNQGADEERRLWIRKVNYYMRSLDLSDPKRIYLDALKEWGKGRAGRNKKKAGGL